MNSQLLPFHPGLFSQGLGELIEFVRLVVKGKGDDASHEKRHGELVFPSVNCVWIGKSCEPTVTNET